MCVCVERRSRCHRRHRHQLSPKWAWLGSRDATRFGTIQAKRQALGTDSRRREHWTVGIVIVSAILGSVSLRSEKIPSTMRCVGDVRRRLSWSVGGKTMYGRLTTRQAGQEGRRHVEQRSTLNETSAGRVGLIYHTSHGVAVAHGLDRRAHASHQLAPAYSCIRVHSAAAQVASTRQSATPSVSLSPSRGFSLNDHHHHHHRHHCRSQ